MCTCTRYYITTCYPQKSNCTHTVMHLCNYLLLTWTWMMYIRRTWHTDIHTYIHTFTPWAYNCKNKIYQHWNLMPWHAHFHHGGASTFLSSSQNCIRNTYTSRLSTSFHNVSFLFLLFYFLYFVSQSVLTTSILSIALFLLLLFSSYTNLSSRASHQSVHHSPSLQEDKDLNIWRVEILFDKFFSRGDYHDKSLPIFYLPLRNPTWCEEVIEIQR